MEASYVSLPKRDLVTVKPNEIYLGIEPPTLGSSVNIDTGTGGLYLTTRPGTFGGRIA